MLKPPPARHLVVALHGYGGTGPAMAAVLAACVPPDSGVVVVAPTGPHRPEYAPHGRAWFPITSQRAAIGERARQVAPAVARWVADQRRRYDVPPDRTCLVGFSQGAAVAVAALTDDPPCDRAVLVCGRIPTRRAGPSGAADGVGDAPGRKLDVLVVAGGQDRFAPCDAIRGDLAASDLGDRTRLVVLPDLGHAFTPEAARLALGHATGLALGHPTGAE